LNLYNAVLCNKFRQIIEIITFKCAFEYYGLMQCAKLWNYVP